MHVVWFIAKSTMIYAKELVNFVIFLFPMLEMSSKKVWNAQLSLLLGTAFYHKWLEWYILYYVFLLKFTNLSTYD